MLVVVVQLCTFLSKVMVKERIGEPDMKNYLPQRIWFIASFTMVLSGVFVRLGWEVSHPISAGSLVVVSLIMLVTLGIYILGLYLTIKPSMEKLKSLPVRISVVVILTGALIDAIIHYIRFIPSPQAAAPLSVVIASLFIASAISAYPLTLWFFLWFARNSGKRS